MLKNNMEELSKTHRHLKLAWVSLPSITVQCNGDSTDDLVDTYKVEQLPTLVIIHVSNSLFDLDSLTKTSLTC